MKRFLFIVVVLFASICYAQDTLYKHVDWYAYGSHDDQAFGFSGLDTIGYVNDTIHHALSIGADGGASYVLNRFPVDTARQYKFPTANVLPANFNGDQYKDFVCWNANGDVTVLLGTPTFNKFDTAFVLHFGNRAFATAYNFIQHEVFVCDCDSDGYDDLLIAAYGLGKIYLYKGGAKLHPVPNDSITISAQEITMGHVQNTNQLCLAQSYWEFSRYYSDTVTIELYPIGKNFHLIPTDVITCRIDSGGTFSGGFTLADAYGDGTDAILLGCSEKVLIYRGGQSISPQPTSYLSNPSHLISDTYGQLIVNVGHTVNPNYESILVCDPQAGLGNAGAVYLFNMGDALKDTVVAEATMENYSFAQFGAQAIGIGDVNGDGLADFMVGGDETLQTNHAGQVFVFLGNSNYGSKVGVHEDGSIPVVFSLSQNYPNPSSSETHIDFSVLDSRLYGSQITLMLYNEFGDRVATLYRGAADNVIRTLHVNTEGLPSGNYYYRMECGGKEETKMLGVVR